VQTISATLLLDAGKGGMEESKLLREKSNLEAGKTELFLSIFYQKSLDSVIHGLRKVFIGSELEGVPCDGFI
jgi:hypothetical protein